MGCRCRITVGVGMFLLSLFIMDSYVSFLEGSYSIDR